MTKKAFYRAADFQVRDIFDMAVVLQQYPGTLWDQRRILFSKLDTLDGRLAHMHAPYAEHAVRLIQVLPDGVRYLPNAYEVVTDFVKKLKADRGG